MDINECLDVIKPCQNHECVNTLGTYYCKCIDGFEYDENSEKTSDDLSQCVNINECEKRIHKCDSGRGQITVRDVPYGDRIWKTDEKATLRRIKELNSNTCQIFSLKTFDLIK